MPPPGFDQHLGFSQAIEDLTIEQFVAKRPVEAKGGGDPPPFLLQRKVIVTGPKPPVKA